MSDKALKYDEGKQDLSLLGRNFTVWLTVYAKTNDIILTSEQLNISDWLGGISYNLSHNHFQVIEKQINRCMYFIELHYTGALDTAIKVFEFGKSKYAKLNYALPMDDLTRLIAAGMRHYKDQVVRGTPDDESGWPHIAHTVCCLLMLYEQLERIKNANE